MVTTAELIPAMTERIVRRFDPLRIILFGSQARGDAKPWSDVDLLVVLPEVANERETRLEIGKALRDFRVETDITVTTPAEIRRRGDLVGTVLRPALREGSVLYEQAGDQHEWRCVSVNEDEVSKEVWLWLQFAEEDLTTAELLLGHPETAPRQAGFLAQQAAEKALKAIFIFLQVQYPFTHNLDELRERLPAGWRVKEEHPDLKGLSAWAVEPRYPSRFLVTRDEARGVVQQARAVQASVLRGLRAHGFATDAQL